MSKYKLRDHLMDISGREFVVGSLTTSTVNSEALYSLVPVTGLNATLSLTESEVAKLFTRMAVQQTPVTPTVHTPKFNLNDIVEINTTGPFRVHNGARGIIWKILNFLTAYAYEVEIGGAGQKIYAVEKELTLVLSATQTQVTPPPPTVPTYPFTSPSKFSQGELVCFRTVPTEAYEVMSKGLVDNCGKLGYWIAKPHTPAVVVWAEESELDDIYVKSGFSIWAQPEKLRYTGNEATIKAPVDPHKNHEIVINQVLGKLFKYCRHCKVEV